MSRTPATWSTLPTPHRCLFAGLAASYTPELLRRAPWETLPADDALDLVRLAEAVDMAGVVVANLQAGGLLSALPGEAAARLMAQGLAKRAQSQSRRAWLAELDGALAARGLEVVALKGAALLLAGTRHAAERGMGDIDLLVRLEQRAEVAAALASTFGDRATTLCRPVGGDWDLATPADLVELHVQVFDKIGPFRPQHRALWETAVPVEGAAALRRCAPAYVAAHAVVEYGLEGFHGMGSDLRGVHDLAALLEAGLEEGEAREAARRVGCGWLLREMLPVARGLLEGSTEAWVALWDRNPALDPRAPRLRGLRYRQVKYRRIPSWAGRALALWREVFPCRQPGDGLGVYLAGCAAPWGIRGRRLWRMDRGDGEHSGD